MFTLKKTLMMTTVASSLLTLPFASQAADASSAQVTVSATIANPTCEWESGDGNQQIDLGQVNMAALTAGKIEKTFILRLKNCPAGLVFVTVNGDEKDGVFANKDLSPGAADNIGVTLWNNYTDPAGGARPKNDYTRVLAGRVSRKAAVGATDHTAELPFKAKLQIVSGSVPKAGNIYVPITMNISYN